VYLGPKRAGEKRVTEIDSISGFDRMNKVVELSLKGYNPTQISKELDIKRNEVLGMLEEWKKYAQEDKQLHERAKEAIVESDQHYAMLMKEAWQTIGEADQAGDLRTKATAIKLVAEIQQKQMEMLQKAGVLDNVELGNQLAETEAKQEMLISILREVTSKCDHCRQEVATRLSRVTNKVEPITLEVHQEDV
jgi:hypothetical protein